MNKPSAKELFGFIAKRVGDLAGKEALKPYEAFPLWFANMYYTRPENVIRSDGPGDSKIDLSHPLQPTEGLHPARVYPC